MNDRTTKSSLSHTRQSVLRTADILEMTTLSRTTLYELLARGEFPPPFNLTGTIKAWRRETVEQWLDSRERLSLSSNINGVS